MMLPDFSKNFAHESVSKKEGSAVGSAQREEVMPPRQEPPVGRIDIRYILSVLLLTFSIISIGGLFGLNAYLDRETESIEGSIDELEVTVKTHDILDLALFDTRVQALKELTVSRSGYSLLLAEASKLVVPGVHYSLVSIVFDTDGYTLSVNGVADSLAHYHQQIQRIETAEGLLAGGVFDGYTLQSTEGGGTTVLFTVTFKVSVTKVADLLNSLS